MIDVVIQRSDKPGKKYDAVINGNKVISFGAKGYEDFTIHKDVKRREHYIKRHSNECWDKANLASPAFMSRWILWEKPSINEAIKHANNMYKDVKFHLT